MEPAAYRHLLSYASEATKFGYAYRIAYEELQRRGELGSEEARYSLTLDEAWTFAAVAALSGIIGNVAYDVMKAALKRIIGCVQKNRRKGGDRPIPRSLRSEEGICIFIGHVRDFCNGLRELDPDVKRAIRDEIIVDLLVDLKCGEAGSDGVQKARFDPRDRDTLKRVLMQGTRVASITERPIPEDFTGFWRNLPVEVPLKGKMKKDAQATRGKQKARRQAKKKPRRK